MGYSLFGLIILIADLYAIYQTLTSSASTAAKVVWTLVILFLPVIGLIAWLVAGPRGSAVRV
ncbi:MAG: PLD nuclease N-terminal domain-containing protein [Pseudomonadota bacterium]|nr:PLD nuclease N-terminal domain-containing protein [Pseudomonadota bacterium]